MTIISTLTLLGDKQTITREAAAKELTQLTFDDYTVDTLKLVLTLMSNSKRFEDRIGSLMGFEVLLHKAYEVDYC